MFCETFPFNVLGVSLMCTTCVLDFGLWTIFCYTHTHTHISSFFTHPCKIYLHTHYFSSFFSLSSSPPPHIHIGIGVCFYYKIIFVKHQRKKMFFACLFSCSVSISLLSPPSAFITFFLLFKFPAIFSGHCARGGRA